MPVKPPENPQLAASFTVLRYMYFPPVANLISAITIDLTGCCTASAGSQAADEIEIRSKARS